MECRYLHDATQLGKPKAIHGPLLTVTVVKMSGYNRVNCNKLGSLKRGADAI